MADRHVDNVNVYRLNPVDMVEPGKWIGWKIVWSCQA
jgi:hypothetical protein